MSDGSMTKPYTCNHCHAKLDYAPTNELGCRCCGYPLDLSKILEFLKSNQSRIKKVESAEFEFSTVKEISLADTFRQFEEYEDMLLPERFTDDEVIVSIVNTKFRFKVQ